MISVQFYKMELSQSEHVLFGAYFLIYIIYTVRKRKERV